MSTTAFRTPLLVVLTLCLGAVFMGLTGCSGYKLEGRVIAGDASYITIVDRDHPMLSDGRGLGGASLHLQENPGRLNATSLARTVSNPDGTFSIPVDLLGAGMLQHDVGLFVRRTGSEPAELPFRLPGKGKSVLVVLKSGEDRAFDEGVQSIIEESMQAW